MSSSDERVAREAGQEVATLIERTGMFFRTFWRVKDERSANKKIVQKNYSAGKKMQDCIGVRLALYFADDVSLSREILTRRLGDRFVSETVDEHAEHQFQPRRLNMIVKMRGEWRGQVSILQRRSDVVDDTYELQLRTVLSEGWHEVEHDLRYKELHDWEQSPESSRILNGILATLEVCDWSMLQVFDELAHRHYKERNWEAIAAIEATLTLSRREA